MSTDSARYAAHRGETALPAASHGEPVIRARALVVGALLVPVVVGITQSLEIAGNYPGLAQGPYASNYLIPFPSLCALLLLMGVNVVAGRGGKPWLRAQELLAVYVMTTVSITAGSAMFGSGVLQVMGVVHWSALRQGQASPVFELLRPLLPRALTVSDARVLDPLYNGGGAPPWGQVALALGGVLALWALLMLAVSLLLYGLAIMLSRQWVQHERLPYPVVQLPLALVEPASRLSRSRLYWVGILLPVALHGVNGMTRLLPVLPPLRIVHYADYLTASRPWTSAWPIVIWLNVSAIAIGFFVPTDVLFSAWLFVWVNKAALVATNALGFGEPSIYQGAPHVAENSYGAYLALAFYAGWAGRAHLRRIAATRGAGSLDEPGRALLWLVAGATGAVALFVRWVVGLSWWAAVLFSVLFVGFSLGLARLRAQAAPPDPGLTIGQADTAMKVALGPSLLGPRSIVGLSLYLNSFTRWGQRNPIGAMTDALRLRREGARGWWGVIPLALAVAIPSGLLITLSLYFRYGLANQAYYWQGASGEWMASDAYGLLTASERWRAGPLLGIASGLVITVGLAALRGRFVGFPLHPIGVAIGAGYGMHAVWFAVFLVWAIKVSLLRWGGLRAYRAAFPFFAGLIVGEALMQAAWSGINAALGAKFYTCTE